MISVESIVLALIALLGAASLLLLLGAGARTLWLRWTNRSQEQRARRMREVLAEHQREGWSRVEGLLHELRAESDPHAIDRALAAIADDDLDRGDDLRRQRLRRIYGETGLLDVHLTRLRKGVDWRQRAESALLLARLGDLRAIPALAETLHDPYEDESTVKTAVARALALFRDPGTAAALLTQLREHHEWSSPRIAAALVALGEDAVPACIEALSDDNQNLRGWAAQVLGQVGDPRSVPALIQRLDDRSAAVRLAATEALGRLGERAAVAALATAVVRDPAAQVRAEAARALGRIGESASAGPLVEALRDPDYWTRLRAVEAIERIGPSDPELLVAACRDEAPEVASVAAAALERTGFVVRWVDELASPDASAVDHARRRLAEVVGRGAVAVPLRLAREHGSLGVRVHLCEIFGEFRTSEAVGPLHTLLRDPEWPVRVAAAQALGRIGVPDAQPLLALLGDPEELVREAALHALRGAPVPAEPRLARTALPLVGSQNAEVRRAALDLLDAWGLSEAAEAARPLLADPDAGLRARAVAVLGSRLGDRAIDIHAQMLRDSAPEVRVEAARSLGALGTPSALRAMVTATFDADPATREVITDTLAKLEFSRLFECLDEFMASERIEARLAALWMLGKAQDPRAVQLLAASLSDPRPRVRAAACGALGRYSSEESRSALEDALHDRSEFARAAAVNALGKVGDPDSVPALQLLLRDPDPFVRRRVVLALGRLGEDEVVPELVEILAGDGDEVLASAVSLALLHSATAIAALATWLSVEGRPALLAGALQQEPPEIAEPARDALGLFPAQAGDAELDRWANQLHETLATGRDAEQRLRALELLRARPGGLPTAWLEHSLGTDPDERVRRRAVELLKGAGGGDRPLLRALRDPSQEVRRAALGAVTDTLRGPEAGSAVLHAAGSDPDLEADGVAALAAVMEDDGAELIDLLMGAGKTSARRVAIRALARLHEPLAIPALRHLILDPDQGIRVESAIALGLIGGRDAAEALEDGLRDPVEEVRAAALHAVASAVPDGALKVLPTVRLDPSDVLRAGWARAISEVGSVAVVGALTALSTDPAPPVRREALLGLLRVPNGGGLGPFLERVPQLDPIEIVVLRESAHSRQLAVGAETWVTTSTASVRRFSVAVLRWSGPMRHREALLQALRDPDPGVRLGATEALAEVDDASIRMRLAQTAHDADPAVRAVARRAAGRAVG